MVITAHSHVEFVRWWDIYSIRLYSGNPSTLKQIGGNASDGQLKQLYCSPSGFNGINIIWQCGTDILPNYRLHGINIMCEHFNAEIILEGTCRAEYILNKVSENSGAPVCVLAQQNNNGIFVYTYTGPYCRCASGPGRGYCTVMDRPDESRASDVFICLGFMMCNFVIMRRYGVIYALLFYIPVVLLMVIFL